MPSDLNRKLLEGDLDRIIEAARFVEYRVSCDLSGRQNCLLSSIAKPGASLPPEDCYAIIEASELIQFRKQLREFQRRWKELNG